MRWMARYLLVDIGGKEGANKMKSYRALRLRSWLLASSMLLAVVLVAGLGGQPAYAASAYLLSRSSGQVQPFAGCAPCISDLEPAQNGTATPDASEKVTLSFTAQLTDPFAKFVLTLDNTTIDSAQIQVDTADPLQPTGKYTAALSAGTHTATIEVDDVNGPAASFPGWTFSVPTFPKPTATPTTTSASGGSGGSGGSSSGSSIFAPKTLSIILFSIAGLGLLVIIFIAGMWYSGSRELRKNP